MGAGSKRKGTAGERELAGLLRDALGFDVKRKLCAARDGGSDLAGVPGWSIEGKDTAWCLEAYWQQTIDQARAEKRRPVLFWKEPRKGWRVFVDAHDVRPDVWPIAGWNRLQMTLDAWCQLAREMSC